MDPLSLPDNDGRTAIYDIAAHAVYLPNGRRLGETIPASAASRTIPAMCT